jgi:hypothetical protein
MSASHYPGKLGADETVGANADDIHLRYHNASGSEQVRGFEYGRISAGLKPCVTSFSFILVVVLDLVVSQKLATNNCVSWAGPANVRRFTIPCSLMDSLRVAAAGRTPGGEVPVFRKQASLGADAGRTPGGGKTSGMEQGGLQDGWDRAADGCGTGRW